MTDHRISLTLTFASAGDPAVVSTRVGEVVAAEVAAPLIGMNWSAFNLAEDQAEEDGAAADWQDIARGLESKLKKESERRYEVEQERDSAYRERAHLVALLAAMTDGAVIAPAPDVDEPGWQIVYLTLGGRQASWHITPRDAALFPHVERVELDDPRGHWNGHTTEEKYEGIAVWAAELAQRCGPACSEMHTETGRCEIARNR